MVLTEPTRSTKKRQNDKRPCPCSKCEGEIKDRHTVARHRKEMEESSGAVPPKVYLGKSRSKGRTKRSTANPSKGRNVEDDSMDINDINENSGLSGGGSQVLDTDGNSMDTRSVSPSILPDASPTGEPGSPRMESPAPAFDQAQQPAPIVPTILNGGHDGDVRGDEYEHENRGLPSSRSPSPDQEDDFEEPLADGGVIGGLGALDPTAEDGPPPPEPSLIDAVRFADEFIALIREATLDDDKLSEETLHALRNPTDVPYATLSNEERVSLTLYLDCNGASQDVYEAVRHTVETEHPDAYPEGLLSHYRVERLMERITGIVSVEDDMCVTGCCAYAGPWEGRQVCADCGKDRYQPQVNPNSRKARVPKQQMTTLPLGPQIQAYRRSGPGSEAMQYRARKVDKILADLGEGEPIVFDDVFSGSDYLELHQKANITADDTVLGFTIDGAQLYQDKKSDAWIAAWIIYDYDPATRYKRKHVLPALIIPGPEKPKHLDSFLYRSFYHLSALQRENNGRGLKVWDHSKKAIIYSRMFFLFGLADTVGLTELDGRVGHHGAVGCRLGCPMKGRHKPGQGHYYAAHKRPTVPIDPDIGIASDHPDFDFSCVRRLTPEEYEANVQKVRASTTLDAYATNRRDTGISKPSIISALVPELSFAPPKCFTVDLMHHFYNNIPVLFIAHWRGTIKCEPTDSKLTWFWVCLTGDNWTSHGLDVANAGQYLPSMFHRIPRNPALKISSSYKCTEWNIYFYKLGRVLFRKYLPKVIWQHYCLLVHAVDILSQRSITPEQLAEAHTSLLAFVQGYEDLYYQGREDRLHHWALVPSSVHCLVNVFPTSWQGE